MLVRVSAEAKADLARIADFIARADPERAISFIDELEASCRSLADFPNRFPLIERYARHRVRRRLHGDYLIFYRVEPEIVVVLRVLHGATDYAAILFSEDD